MKNDDNDGFVDAQRPEQIARSAKMPKDKKTFVASYLSVMKRKLSLLNRGLVSPKVIEDELKCYHRFIYQRFSAQERTLLESRVAVIKNGMKL